MRKLLSWPEFVVGFKRMQQLIRDKEAAGDFSPIEYRIDLDPPHRSHGQSFIILSHHSARNRTIIFGPGRKRKP